MSPRTLAQMVAHVAGLLAHTPQPLSVQFGRRYEEADPSVWYPDARIHVETAADFAAWLDLLGLNPGEVREGVPYGDDGTVGREAEVDRLTVFQLELADEEAQR